MRPWLITSRLLVACGGTEGGINVPSRAEPPAK
jgi:hypothetical protein